MAIQIERAPDQSSGKGGKKAARGAGKAVAAPAAVPAADMDEEALRLALGRAVKAAGGTDKYAKANSLPAETITQFMAGSIKPPAKLLKAMGVSAVTVYRQRGRPAS